ncbi:SWIM zinc finger family protein [Rhizohabitans arisaemae]|uniref:SWIM zinc finger family protein n=1 Tax=Rhizohabitans arisaemae TaxID=2720610 RepID=UPI0024B0B6C2|nr:SWIM zinc finger family protein [Rhizohabitans arisaemae]
MIERWSRDRVLGLAPDAAAQAAGRKLAVIGTWSGAGRRDLALWGECRGSGAKPYLACVDLGEPAYRCSCPSRKFPCKHVLGLLLLWSQGEVAEASEVVPWVETWLDGRRERVAKQSGRAAAKTGKGEGGQRETRVVAGLRELDLWLCDQVRHGLTAAGRTPGTHGEDIAKRMIDAQAPGVAARLNRMTDLVRAGDGWPGRLLEEYALLHLLAVGYPRAAELPEALRHTIRAHVGFTVERAEVLARPHIRDRWQVLGSRDEQEDRLIRRRVWLRGTETGRTALVLSFAPQGQALDASLVTGTTVDADLAFYPGRPELRAVVAGRHGGGTCGEPQGGTVEAALRALAAALADDPWLDPWPMLLSEVVPVAKDGWWIADAKGDALPLRGSDHWRLLAHSGGHPVTVLGEWTPRGLIPLTGWDDEGQVIVL